MSRFYIPPEAVRGKHIAVTGPEAHHIIDVMRMRPGDNVVTFDGAGKEYAGMIKDVKAGKLTIEILAERKLSDEPGLKVTLLQAIPKKEKMDYIVEKATELGVSEIIPMVTERTIPRWDKSKRDFRTDRWRKIAKEASKQSGRVEFPAVRDVAHFDDIVRDFKAYDIAIMAALNDDAVPIKKVLKGSGPKRMAVAIGPEGDFTGREIESARLAGFRLVDLGPRVMKSDTAGLAVLSMINYEYSD